MSRWDGLAEAVYAHPSGASTAARLALTAKRVGYDQLVIKNADTIPTSPPIEAIADEYDIDIISGIELDGPIETVSGRLPHLRRETSVLAVRGGTDAKNRFVARQPYADILAGPITHEGPDIGPGIATDASEHEVAIEVDLGPLRTQGGRRVRYIDRLRRLWRVVDHYDLEYVLTASPSSHLGVVPPRELVALADLVGIDADAAVVGLETWVTIARRNQQQATD